MQHFKYVHTFYINAPRTYLRCIKKFGKLKTVKINIKNPLLYIRNAQTVVLSQKASLPVNFWIVDTQVYTTESNTNFEDTQVRCLRHVSQFLLTGNSANNLYLQTGYDQIDRYLPKLTQGSVFFFSSPSMIAIRHCSVFPL